MNSLLTGDVITVEVTNVSSHGVSIEYCDQKGFVQIPELSWDLYGLQNRIQEICKVGDMLQVKVLSQTDDRFYASLRQAKPEQDPWSEKNILVVGEQLTGEVVLVADYGYLIKLPNFVVSMIPLEASVDRLRSGQFLDVRVAEVDSSAQKVYLQIN